MLGSGLYYPYIDIDNSAWLRSTILFWDEISTITPRAIKHPYRSQDSQICYEEGYLKPIYCDLKEKEIEALGTKILRSDSRKRLFKQMRSPLESPAFNSVREHAPFSLRLADERREGRLHIEKIPYAIRQMFTDKDFFDQGEEGWLLVNREFADAYMSALASGIAKAEGMSPLTSSDVASGMSFRFQFGDAVEEIGIGSRSAMIAMVIRGLNVDASVPIQRLIEFRHQRRDQYLDFAAKIAELADQITVKGRDQAELVHKTEAIYDQKIAPGLRALKRELDNQGIATAWGGAFRAMTLAAPSAGILNYLTGASPSLLLGAGAALLAADIGVQTILGGRRLRSGQPFSYLHDVHESFGLPDQDP